MDENVEIKKMTNKQFTEYSRVKIHEAIMDLERAILHVAEEATRREILDDVEQISIMILQETMNATVRVMKDMNAVVTEAYKMCEMIERMPRNIQIKLQEMMSDVQDKIGKEMNEEETKEKKEVFNLKPK